MLENLKHRKEYGGFAFLAEDAHGVPWLKTHHHRELEINLVVRGSVTYVIGQSGYTFPQGELFWLFPGQPHRVVHRSADAQYHVAVFKPSLIRSCCHSEENQLLLDERPPRNAVLHCSLSPSAYSLVCERQGGEIRRRAEFGCNCQHVRSSSPSQIRDAFPPVDMHFKGGLPLWSAGIGHLGAVCVAARAWMCAAAGIIPAMVSA